MSAEDRKPLRLLDMWCRVVRRTSSLDDIWKGDDKHRPGDRMCSQSPVCSGCSGCSGGGGDGSAAVRHNDNSGNIAGSGDRGTNTNANEILSAPRNLSQSHARRHYDETLHAYALDMETQHVRDFAGQGYIHRLLQNKADGKWVEFHDPSNTPSHERSLTPGLSDTQEGEVVHRKLEGFASQYYTLLKSYINIPISPMIESLLCPCFESLLHSVPLVCGSGCNYLPGDETHLIRSRSL